MNFPLRSRNFLFFFVVVVFHLLQELTDRNLLMTEEGRKLLSHLVDLFFDFFVDLIFFRALRSVCTGRVRESLALIL